MDTCSDSSILCYYPECSPSCGNSDNSVTFDESVDTSVLVYSPTDTKSELESSVLFYSPSATKKDDNSSILIYTPNGSGGNSSIVVYTPISQNDQAIGLMRLLYCYLWMMEGIFLIPILMSSQQRELSPFPKSYNKAVANKTA